MQECAYAVRPTPYGHTCNVLPIRVNAGFVEAGSHYIDEVEYVISMAQGPAEDAAAAVDAKSIVVQGWGWENEGFGDEEEQKAVEDELEIHVGGVVGGVGGRCLEFCTTTTSVVL